MIILIIKKIKMLMKEIKDLKKKIKRKILKKRKEN